MEASHRHHHHHGGEVGTLDRGLAFDLSTLIERRTLMRLTGVTGLLAIAGCADAVSGSTTTAAAPTQSSAGDVCDDIPEETAGPFPGDGSNGPNALTESGIVRSDITSSFGS